MDTTEARASSSQRRQQEGLVYDGFISYSHAADDLLAPRLQAGLQRFAKPWWKRRALRIFRDESSLAANPHLWSSITDSLDGSGWFVVLLSPEAAESDWVNKEVEYWLEHKDPARIIPVVTDGEFAWGSADIDPVSTSAPPALYGTFSDEPRWVDLRFARTEAQLDLNNASFRAAVADIASAIRGVPKDELESEEVRQHRRTVRTAWAAGIALLFLVVLAGAAAIYAIGQRNDANEQRVAAEESAAEADAQRQVAEDQTAVAQNQTAVAEQLEFDARSDALAAGAIAQLDIDPELALLLATEALQREVQPSALSATHQALQRNRTIFQIDVVPGSFTVVSGAVGGLSPAGDLLVVTGQGRDLEVWEVGGDEPVWTVQFPVETATVLSARFTVDGSAVVAFVAGLVSENSALDPTQLFVFDAATGREVATIPNLGCVHRMVYPSPLSEYVDLTAPIPWIRSGLPCDFLLNEAGFVDPVTGSFSAVTEIVPRFGRHRIGVPTVDASGRFFAVGSTGPGQVIDLETGELVFSFDGGIATLSGDGTRLLARGHATGQPLELWDLANEELLWAVDKTFTRAWFSGDASMVYGTSRDGSTYVFDAATGERILRLAGQEGVPLAAVMSRSGDRMATFATDFTARVWDLGAVRSEGARYVTNTQPRAHTAASADLSGGVAAVWGGALHQEDELWDTTVVDLSSGETLATVTGGVPTLSPDGTLLAYRAIDEVEVVAADLKGRGEPGLRPRVGQVRIIDVSSGELVLEIDVPCEQYLMPGAVVLGVDCSVEGGGREWDLEFSSDGRMLGMADPYDRIVTIWDTTTGGVIARTNNRFIVPRAIAFTPDSRRVAFIIDLGQLGISGEIEQLLIVHDIDPLSDVDRTLSADALSPTNIHIDEGITFAEMVFTRDGSLLVAAAGNGDVMFFDATTWELAEPIAAHDGSTLDVAVNEAGTLIASAGDDGFVRVWNLSDRLLVTEIRFDVKEIANVEFIDDTHLFVTPGFGNEAIVITLDSDELLAIAQSRLIRSFTQDECATYGIDPCPTLAAIKGE